MVGTIGAIAVFSNRSGMTAFASDGYILNSDGGEISQYLFEADSQYAISRTGSVTLRDNTGASTRVFDESFVHMNDNNIIALKDGVLLDFNDLSDNFINNYYLTSELPISSTGDEYMIEMATRDIVFGDHIWKLSDNKYLVRANSLSIHFSEDDIRDIGDYVEISISQDGIVNLMTDTELFNTISHDCYIETGDGVRVYPVGAIVDSGDYQIGLSNLVINPDDSIVLSEDELRRQIVPEINIEAVDGEDGEVGASGLQGEQGEQGNLGETGEVGEDGEEGEGGSVGEGGEVGQQGDSGDGGSSGSKGSVGSTGTQGVSVNVSGSTNAALPSFAITQWKVGSTKVQGEITISDETGRLGVSSGSTGTVTLTAEDGTVINCYPITGIDGTIGGGVEPKFDFTSDLTFYFSTQPEALKPDTKYTLSVVAPYKADDITESIYRREFISRSFITDGSGVVLTEESASEHSLTINVETAKPENLEELQVYMLTAEQNKSFTINAADYLEKVTIDHLGAVTYAHDKDNNTTGVSFNSPFSLTFEETDSGAMTPNTQYYFRMVIKTNDGTGTGLDSLSNFALDLETLKTKATVTGEDDGLADIEVLYNRNTGSMEVSRPVVTDTHGGVVRYNYYCYELNDDGSRVEPAVIIKSALPSDPYEVPFSIDSNKNYEFDVVMVFDDNSKIIEEVIGTTTTPVRIEGAMLPTLTLNAEEDKITYSSLDGNIGMVLDSGSSLEIDPSHPFELQIYADGVQEISMSFDRIDEEVTDTVYTHGVELEKNSDTNYTIQLNLKNLKSDTNYTIRLRGYLNVGTGEALTPMTIGSVSFRTKTNAISTASWTIPTGATGSIDRMLSIQLADDDDKDFTLEKLYNGKVEIGLYVGTSGQSAVGTTHVIAGEDNLKDLFSSTGYHITDDKLGVDAHNSDNSNYMLRIESVVDETYLIESEIGYVNDFTSKVSNRTTNITIIAKAPDLPTRPEEAVSVTPIYNEYAASYGADRNTKLPDDAVIGYTLQAEYNNANRSATSVTYYAFEYEQFYNALQNNKDPIEAVDAQQFKIKISEIFGDEVEPITVLFDRNLGFDGTEGTDANGNKYIHDTIQNRKIYQFEPDSDDFVLDRGYKYVFAYTVEYEIKDENGQVISGADPYPYVGAEYDAAKTSYGVGTHLGTQLGTEVAYVLNSGIISAPLVSPQLFNFLFDVTYDNSTEGSAEIHYKFIDNEVDSTINTTNDITQITFDSNETESSVDINGEALDDDWYKLSVPFKLNGNDDEIVLTPRVEISTYRVDYDDILDKLLADQSSLSKEEEDELYAITYLAEVPVESGYGEYFKSLSAFTVTPKVEADENRIILNLSASDAGSEAFRRLINRIYMLEVTVKSDTTTDPITKTLFLPVNVGGGISTEYHAILPTSEISEFIGKGVDFLLSYKVYYDTGEQGFSLLSTNPYFGLQNTGTRVGTNAQGEAQINYDLGYYIAANGASSNTAPTNSLASLSGSFDMDDLYKSYNAIDTDNSKDSISYRFSTLASMTSANTRYLAVTKNGVDFNTNSGMGYIGNNYFTIKGYAAMSDSDTEDEISSEQIETIIPTVNTATISEEVSLNSYTMNSFAVSAADQINEKNGANPIIHIAFLDLNAYNGATIDLNDIDSTPGYVGNLVTYGEVDAAGKLTGIFKPKDAEKVVEPLAKDTDYLMVFYAELLTGEKTILKESQTSSEARIPFKTLGSIGLAIPEFRGYINNNYFDKYAEGIFTIVNPASDIKITFDIFEADADGKAVESSLLLSSDADKITADVLNIMDYLWVSTGDNYHHSNSFRLNLEPGMDIRDKLVPGKEYVFRITAESTTAGSGEEIKEVKEDIIVIPPQGQTANLIYTTETTATSISFTTTIIDSNYTLMGQRQDSTSNSQMGIYGVRFTYVADDGREIALDTLYDDNSSQNNNPRDFYYTNEIKQVFTLNAGMLDTSSPSYATAKTIFTEGRKFNMYIYAATDSDNDGESLSTGYKATDAADDIYTAEELFGKASATLTLEESVEIFDDVINNFRGVDQIIKDDLKDAELRFRIAEKSGSLSSDDGILINEDLITVSRDLSNLQINFRESFGFLESITENQVFDRVEWDLYGMTTTHDTLSINGVRTHDDAYDDLIKKVTDNLGYDVYAITIPANNLPRGEYTITLKMYLKDDASKVYTVTAKLFDS